MRIFLATATVALAFAGTASAAGIADLTAAGYTVSIAGPYPTGCTTYSVSGHSMSSYISLCTDPVVQATIDASAQSDIASWTNPSTIFEADWQTNHPDQVTAATKIGSSLCYSITRSAPATDSWIIVGGGTNLTSSGAGLVPLSGSLPNVCAQNPTPIVSIVPTTDGITNTPPGAASTVTAIGQQAAGQQQQTTTTTTTTAPVSDAQIAFSQAVTVSIKPGSPTTITAALSKSVGATVVLTPSTTYKLRGIRLTAKTFAVAFKTHHRVKITGTRKNGKLVAATVTLLV